MLRTRIITALLLVVGLIPAIFYLDRMAWAVLTAVITALGAWEFGRLAGFCSAGQIRYGVLVGVLAAAFIFLLPLEQQRLAGQVLLILSAGFWALLIPLWLRARWHVKRHGVMAIVGLIVLLPTWYALIALRDLGPGWLLGAILMVAVADIAAYFFGRAFGKRKLAPSISPGKTWEGAWGAMATVTLLTMGLQIALDGKVEVERLVILLLVMPVLTLLSISGDLFESMLKRAAGLKDSSQLLPGHGGVLDRIDSHTAALPLITLLLVFL